MSLKVNAEPEELTREEALLRFGPESLESGDREIENDSAEVYWEDMEGSSYRVVIVGVGGEGVKYILLS